ncbi:hypothetical protein H072_7388 [Dactylellina haptotyla CBS 200.50]|uniref:Uncharacterized protein n=1 Tax=Dactylellina haptotyla (strain CBS 200.50) TaxID=1284197 RepID=S8A7R6_DACHA|nr:hypothetical protein H072_7388 [Dactylellina haptotyla CBS 200.50]
MSTRWEALTITVTPPLRCGVAQCDLYWENCGEEGYCINSVLGPNGGACGRWLGQDNMCCQVGAVSESSDIASVPCKSVPNIRDTPLEKFGNGAYNLPIKGENDRCPNGEFVLGYSIAGGGGYLCCDSGMDTRIDVLTRAEIESDWNIIIPDENYRCGLFDVFPTAEDLANWQKILNGSSSASQGIETMSETSMAAETTSGTTLETSSRSVGTTSTMEAADSSTTSEDDSMSTTATASPRTSVPLGSSSTPTPTSSGGPSTSAPTSNAVAASTSTTGGSSTTSTTPNSAGAMRCSKLSSLVLGSAFLAMFLGAQL